MTFDARESSISAGQPIRLYHFRRGALHWRYTNADRDIEYLAQTYARTAIKDDGVRQTGEVAADTLIVTAPWNLAVARLFRGMPPSAEIELTIWDTHYGESEARVAWIGTVQGAKWPTPERVQLICQTLAASFDRPGLRLGWERGCPYTLYDHNCGVLPSSYAVEGTVITVTGATIEAGVFDGFPDGYFAGGYIEWSIGSGELERRGIETHVGGVLGILGGTDGILPGQAVTGFPGCSRTIDVCDTRFGNHPNYGGIPHLPGESPFDGNPVF